MRLILPSRTSIVFVTVLTAILCHQAVAQVAQDHVTQTPAAQTKDAPGRDAKGIPPRATPADYQAHAQAGAITVAAEFTGHSIPTSEAILTTEDYVAVEVGLFGAPEARATFSAGTFLSPSTERRRLFLPCP